MIAALAAGLVAGYGIAVPVGAIGAYLVALTARTTWRIGVFAALGIATADGLYALVAVLAGAAVTPSLQPIMPLLRWASALVLIGLAVRTGAGAVRRYREGRAAAHDGGAPVSAVRAYGALLGLTLLNPVTVVYFAALVLGGQAPSAGRPEQAVFVIAAFAASASWQFLLAGGGALLGRALTGDRGRLGTAVASAAVMCALALHLLITAP